MARGECDGGTKAIARPLVVVACIAIPALVMAFVALRPWHADRPILWDSDLISRRRGNLFGASCTLVRVKHDMRAPWPCGSNARWSDSGGDDVIRVEDVDRRTCAGELRTLRTIGCVDGWVDSMSSSAAEVVLSFWREDPATHATRLWCARIDRVSGAQTMSLAPEGARVVSLGPEVLVAARGRWLYALGEDGFRRVPDDDPRGFLALPPQEQMDRVLAQMFESLRSAP